MTSARQLAEAGRVLTKGDNRQQLGESLAHVTKIEQHIGQLGRQQSIDAAAGAHQIHRGVDHAGAQRAGQHTRHIDNGRASRAVQ